MNFTPLARYVFVLRGLSEIIVGEIVVKSPYETWRSQVLRPGWRPAPQEGRPPQQQEQHRPRRKLDEPGIELYS